MQLLVKSFKGLQGNVDKVNERGILMPMKLPKEHCISNAYEDKCESKYTINV